MVYSGGVPICCFRHDACDRPWTLCHVQLWLVTSFQGKTTCLGIKYNFQLWILVFADYSCNSSIYNCALNQIPQEEEKGRYLIPSEHIFAEQY